MMLNQTPSDVLPRIVTCSPTTVEVITGWLVCGPLNKLWESLTSPIGIGSSVSVGVLEGAFVGVFDGFFVTPECNLNCNFCLSQRKISEKFQGSNWGNDISNNLDFYQSYGIEGISFSGGEPLLKLNELFNWIEMCHNNPSVKHIWLYTNGMLLSKKVLATLAELGLHEIRVNTAATGYQHPHVMDMLRIASQYFDWITVEIPLIPSHAEKLISTLPRWLDLGVRVLNLHELLYEPGSNAENLEGERIEIQLPDGHQTAISPESDQIALRIFTEITQKNLPISVNYCSTVGKWQQLTARRESCLSEVIEPYETYLGDGVLESYFIIEYNQARSIPPHTVEEMRKTRNGKPIYHLKRMAPLSLEETQKNWIDFEVIS